MHDPAFNPTYKGSVIAIVATVSLELILPILWETPYRRDNVHGARDVRLSEVCISRRDMLTMLVQYPY